MALKVLLLDKDREVFPLLGDIFNVTGHKLLVATDVKMFKDLVMSTDVDIVIVNHSDIKAWLSSWKKEKGTLPFFLLDSEEDEEKLFRLGFSELNFVKKPFNPLELLNKLSHLHALSPYEEAHNLKLINTLIKLMNLKDSKIVEVSNSKQCNVLVETGEVRGTDCTMNELITLLGEEHTVKVKEYEDIQLESKFGNTYEFVKTILNTVKPTAVVHREKGLARFVEEVEEDIFRISKFSDVPILLKNVYLRIYRHGDKKIAMLINVGTLDEWSAIRNLIEDTLFSLNELDAVVLLTGELASLYNSFLLIQQRANITFITDSTVKRFLSESGFKSGRIRSFDSFPSYSVTIGTGDRLRFIPVNFSPSVAGFCLYEEDTGFLFTPEFLSSFYNEESANPFDEIYLFHRIYMPCGSILNMLLDRTEGLKVKKVFPRYGMPYGDFPEVRERLMNMKTGLDFPHLVDKDRAVDLLNRILLFVLNNEEKETADKFVEELEMFSTVQGGTVADLHVEPSFVVELVLSTLTAIPGIRRKTIIDILKFLDKEGVFIKPF